MRRFVLPILLGVAATTASTTALGATRTFPVGGFDRIASSVPFDVHVHTGMRPSVRADGPQEALDRLRVEVRGGELSIETQRGSWLSGWSARGQRALIEVGVPMVQATALSGPGNLTVDRVRTPRFAATLSGPGNLAVGSVEARQLHVALSGPGSLSLTGRAQQSNFMLSGPGAIRAAVLSSHDAVVQASGPGDLTTTVTGTVQGTSSGPGNVVIHGGAHCAIARTGFGDVRCR